MSSYLNKLQVARKVAIEKYLVDNGIKYTVVKYGRIKHYILPDHTYLGNDEYSDDELMCWFNIEVKVEG